MKFSAVILAGGKSTRMGRDKAMLEVGGRPLLARQIELARDTGAREVLVSGRTGMNYDAFGCRVLHDHHPDAGPLAGIEAALAAAADPLLLVLAVDMPQMNAVRLRRLAACCTQDRGVVPRVDGHMEPLAAFYPGRSIGLLRELWPPSPAAAGTSPAPRVSMFAQRCAAVGQVQWLDLPAADACDFANWNSPADLPCTT
jgi:molybdopterin-guanine dinucleotide biosynthesis protein A